MLKLSESLCSEGMGICSGALGTNAEGMGTRSGALGTNAEGTGIRSGAPGTNAEGMGICSGAPVNGKQSIFRFESLVERNLGSAVKQETPLNEQGFLFV